MSLVVDQHAVGQRATAGAHPPLDDRVHPGHPVAAARERDPGSARIASTSAGYFPVPVADEVAGVRPGVRTVHDKVAGGRGHPRGARLCGGTRDPDPTGACAITARTDTRAPGRRDGLDDIGGRQRGGLRTQETPPRSSPPGQVRGRHRPGAGSPKPWTGQRSPRARAARRAPGDIPGRGFSAARRNTRARVERGVRGRPRRRGPRGSGVPAGEHGAVPPVDRVGTRQQPQTPQRRPP